MATQGLITIVDKTTKEVLAKVVCGCNGQEIDSTVQAIKKLRREEYSYYSYLEKLYVTAYNASFGCNDCLVVINSKGVYIHNGCEPPPPAYKDTIQQKEFNPRWKSGATDNYKELEV